MFYNCTFVKLRLLFRQDSFEKFDMSKKISNRKFSEANFPNATMPLQSVTEESNLGYKPLMENDDENPTSHHRHRFYSPIGFPLYLGLHYDS